MAYELAYGNSTLAFTPPPGVKPILVAPGDKPGLPDPLAAAHAAVARPTGTPALADMLASSRPGSVVVVVNDITRPTPYGIMLPPLLKAFADAGVRDDQVTFLVATGIHDPHTDEENRAIYGDGIVDRFTVVSHNALDGGSHAYMGAFASGYDFYVNRLASEADFLITLGVIMPHYFAGYSGGRKSILPGLAGKATVEKNHARMAEMMDALPPIDQNPVSLEMIEAARRVGVDFILNVVVNDRQEVVAVAAGDVEKAWRAAVDVSASMYEVPFDRQADVCVTCACGYPRDINAYQAQKALDHADRITRPGGSVILAAECSGGYGDKIFQEWMGRKWPPARVMEEVKKNFVMGGHKAYGFAKVAAEKECWLVSSLSREDSALLYAKKAATVQEAVDAAAARHGAGASWVYMPYGSLSLPVRAR